MAPSSVSRRALVLLGCALGCARMARGVPNEGSQEWMQVDEKTPVFEASFDKGRTVPGSGIGGGPSLADDVQTPEGAPEARIGPAAVRLDLVQVEQVSRDLVSAACDREMRCGRVGGGYALASPQACEQAYRAEVSAWMRATSCPQGYLKSEPLVRCVAAIDARDCDAQGSLWQSACSPQSVCAAP